MDIEKRLSMSFYQTIATLNEEHRIYLAQNTNTGKIYVKKILDVYNKSIYEYLLAHPVNNVPQIIELYEDETTLTVIEEYVSGTTLSELLESDYCFSHTQIVDIISKLCDILDILHSLTPPIIHRDIKPSNIILTANGDIYLIDFNAAKHESHNKEEDTTLLGTKGYAAPEQYGFGVSNPQTDIYAIGMLINTLLCGKFSPTIIEDNIFFPIIKTCIELRPSDRYTSVKELQSRLAKCKIVSTNSSNQRKVEWQSYLPPGFRTFNILKMVLASCVYISLTRLCLTLQIKDTTPVQLQFERIGLLILFLVFIFTLFDYRGVSTKFALCNSNRLFIRIFGRLLVAIIYSALYFFLFLIVAIII